MKQKAQGNASWLVAMVFLARAIKLWRRTTVQTTWISKERRRICWSWPLNVRENTLKDWLRNIGPSSGMPWTGLLEAKIWTAEDVITVGACRSVTARGVCVGISKRIKSEAATGSSSRWGRSTHGGTEAEACRWGTGPIGLKWRCTGHFPCHKQERQDRLERSLFQHHALDDARDRLRPAMRRTRSRQLQTDRCGGAWDGWERRRRSSGKRMLKH